MAAAALRPAGPVPTPATHPTAPDYVLWEGWTRQGPYKVPGGGTLDRPNIDALWQRTGCVCKYKEFNKIHGRELKIWGPPELLSQAHEDAIECIRMLGDTGP